MGFGQEIKDFLSAYKQGEAIETARTDREYKKALQDALVKKTARESGLAGDRSDTYRRLRWGLTIGIHPGARLLDKVLHEFLTVPRGNVLRDDELAGVKLGGHIVRDLTSRW